MTVAGQNLLVLLYEDFGSSKFVCFSFIKYFDAFLTMSDDDKRPNFLNFLNPMITHI